MLGAKVGREFMDPIPIISNGKGIFLMVKHHVSHFSSTLTLLKVARTHKKLLVLLIEGSNSLCGGIRAKFRQTDGSARDRLLKSSSHDVRLGIF